MNQHGAAQIRVLVVDDSPAAIELLVYLLNADPALQVIGTAFDGEQAILAARRLRPDVITMDIHLPKMDGFIATRKIMETCPTRIVMVTASSIPNEVAATFRALEAGALTVLAKPMGPGNPDHEITAEELVRTIKLMAEVPVVKRWRLTATAAATESVAAESVRHLHTGIESVAGAREGFRLVAIGASTGGPLALQTILSRLPREFSVPILIVQHISAGFMTGFTEWLSRTSGYRLCIPLHGERIAPGIAYLAPDGLHMLVTPGGKIELSTAPPEHGLRPSVSCLFRSVASSYGARAVGVLLTGMGRDGAQELKLMREAGAVTIAQDKETAIVYGMPGEAVKLNAVDYILAPEDIAATLSELVKQVKKPV